MRRSTRTIAIAAVVVLVAGGTAFAIGLRSSPPTVPRSRSHPSATTTAARTTQGVALTGAPTPGRVSTVQDVTCSEATCVVVGSSPSGDPLIWWSSDGGATFHPSEDTIAADVTLTDVACQATTCVTTGLAGAETGPGTPVAFASTDGGRTFTPTTLPEGPGGDQLACSRSLCVLAERPLGTGGEGSVLVASHPLGPWTQLHLSFAPATAPTTNILLSSGLVACAEDGPCLVANEVSTAMGLSYVPTVWALTGPRSARVIVATPSAPLGAQEPWCGIETCAILAPRSGTTLALVVATTRTRTRDVVTDPSGSASSDQYPFLDPHVLTCMDRSCIIASPSKEVTPTALWAESDGRLTRLPNSLPAWIQLGLSGAAEPSRGTLLVPAPAHDGSTDASLLRLSVSPTGLTPQEFVTLPPS